MKCQIRMWNTGEWSPRAVQQRARSSAAGGPRNAHGAAIYQGCEERVVHTACSMQALWFYVDRSRDTMHVKAAGRVWLLGCVTKS